MLRCAVVDDEPLAVKMLQSFVERTPFLELVGAWTDPVLAFGEIGRLRPELVFMDIQMPDLDGLELAKMIPSETRVVFTTAFKQYAFDSYEVSALDFLLKPIQYGKFLAAAQKAKDWFDMKNAASDASQSKEKEDTVYLKADGNLHKVKLADILYIEGMKDYVMVHLASTKDTIVTHITMKEMEDMLPAPRFMRVHRSFIVATGHIDSVSTSGDIMIGEKFIHVSESYRDAFDGFIESRTI